MLMRIGLLTARGGGGLPLFRVFGLVRPQGVGFWGKVVEIWFVDARGGGVLPYIRYIGMCRLKGYGF